MKKIIISESQLKRIIDNQINEQTSISTGVQSGTYKPTVSSDVQKLGNYTPQETQLSLAKKKYPCIHPDFVLSYQSLLDNKKYNKEYLKAALSVIGRESSFASGKRYNVLSVFKNLGTLVGMDTSIGPAQMKPSTGKEFGIDDSMLKTNTGGLDASYRYLVKYANIALKNGYTNKPSALGTNGTGNASLDIAIASYNAGGKIIGQWCKTSDPKVCKLCSEITTGAKIPVPNYIPNYTTERADMVNTSTHGYVKEVANYYKKMTC